MEKFTLITGGSSGLGKDLARLFASNNHNLLLISSNEEKLLNTQNELEQEFKNIQILTLCVDLSNPFNFKKVTDFTKNNNVFINVLINNAGYGENEQFVKMDIENNIRMTELNCNAPLYLTHFYLNEMLKYNEGDIINICSVAAFTSAPYMSTYHATKAYLLTLSESISYEIRKTNVNLLTVCPGPFTSNFVNVAKSHHEFNKIKPMTSQKVAKLTYNAYKKKKTIKIIGIKNKLLVIAVKFAPRKLVTKISSLIMKEEN